MRKFRAGLTLIELMAALAISALLATAALAVTARLPRGEAANRQAEERLAPTSAWPSLLAADVAHARSFRATTGGFEMRVHSALDPRTLEVRHMDAIVAWQVRPVAGGRWLVRTQSGANGKVFAELVSRGVRSVEMTPAKGNPQVDAEGWNSIPEAVAVKADFEMPGITPAVFTFSAE